MNGRGLSTLANGMCHVVPLGLGWLCLSVLEQCLAGTKYDGEWKEGKMDGRGVLTGTNGMCHVTPLGLSAGHPSVSMHSALQETDMTASGKQGKSTAGVFTPWPMVSAT